MDVLRFGYSTSMVFRDGDPAVPITWFRAAEDAEVFPAPHCFASTVWENEDWGPLGEQPGPRIWSNGQGPAVLVGKAPFTGQLDWFSSGQPVPDLGLVPTTVGEPESCVSQDYLSGIAIGGVRVGLHGEVGPPPYPKPPLCGGSQPPSVVYGKIVTIFGNTNKVPLSWNVMLGRYEGNGVVNDGVIGPESIWIQQAGPLTPLGPTLLSGDGADFGVCAMSPPAVFSCVPYQARGSYAFLAGQHGLTLYYNSIIDITET